ncbi:SDR family NAD(P)-dependent oxidoreductase [Candidatus Dependentiae bacterium]|nr:SDR family NAD(P)-dependent oxidoreductase [Candidatus Dependentiae bacterium]
MKLFRSLLLIVACSFRAVITDCLPTEKKAIVIGASSGMGREIAKLLSKEGYNVGLVARRISLLESLQKEIATPTFIKQIDVTHPSARQQLQELIEKMGGLDLMVISISAYLDNRNATAKNEADFNPQKTWSEKERTLDVDAKGFIAMADVALDFFKAQGSGHLVGISSTSGQRGVAYSPEYSAAKACTSYYMEGIRNYLKQNNLPVKVTDVVAGYVAVEHSRLGEDPSAYWEVTVEQAGKTIVEGIKKQKQVIYVPSKVWIVSFLLKHLPDYIYNNYLSWL